MPPFALLHNALGQLLFLAMIGYMVYGLARPYVSYLLKNKHNIFSNIKL